MTREKYHESLDILKNDVINMGKLANEAINNSIKSLKDIDAEIAKSVIDGDQPIDDYEMKIEKSISQIIALQSPTAKDMRFVTSCLKIAIDIERMSDLAVNIAEISERIEGEHVKPLVDIPKMAEIASGMLEQAMNAFETNDAELAEATAKKDDEIDRMFYSIEKELIEMMVADESIVTNASHLLFVIRYIERIGDHACNICESVVYIAEAKRKDLN
ncbi:MAG: phosphate transport system protein [Methanolobus sp.]|jgi:phosphate transport system protein|uniref:phosphate signaling complex protein PhoU n=1 Tax=Methanolobus sp. TaxID=1874737 RepID=UPI0024AB274D|nr:phosphate signaling complex protein PhoU [Methanolobus sp.]MDI3486481.1 phosphate transport system protein [Methanolobus sp.]MDK2832322.1 phosphate transport system protein [Methanolobus sp.]MDK2939918.1 phosphate transport system protein [Methanolobus sp.]